MVIAAWIDRGGEAIDDARVAQEVLAEAFAGLMLRRAEAQGVSQA